MAIRLEDFILLSSVLLCKFSRKNTTVSEFESNKNLVLAVAWGKALGR